MAGHHRNMGNKRGTGKFGFAGFRLRNSQLCVCAGKSNFFRVHLYLALAAVFQRVLMATLEAAAANPDPHALPGNGFNIVLFAAAVLLAFNPPTEIQHLHPAFQRDPTVVLIWLTKLRYKAAAPCSGSTRAARSRCAPARPSRTRSNSCALAARWTP